MLLEGNGPRRLNEPMDFLAQAIADLATIVTFQQRRPPAPVPEPDEPDETSVTTPDVKDGRRYRLGVVAILLR